MWKADNFILEVWDGLALHRFNAYTQMKYIYYKIELALPAFTSFLGTAEIKE